MAANNPPSIASVNQHLSRLENRLDILLKRFDVLANRFCLYWIDERKSPAVGIIVKRGLNRDKKECADIFIISSELSANYITTDKLKVEKDESKNQRWEPLVLDQKMFAEAHNLIEQSKDAPPDDGNSALI
ncbi:MAG TPA: hypothetical protein V6D22_16905 [Candidatus Obscuribacterales bacterium]